MSASRMSLDFGVLRLRKNEDRRVASGHSWVYSNEVDVEATPLSALEAGQPVVVESQSGSFLGTGYVNPRALICARVVSRDRERPFGQALVHERIERALRRRDRLYAKPYYRLVYGEGDGLPGLVVDRYAEVCVAQTTTAGMDRLSDVVTEALSSVVRPRALLWRNDGAVRAYEGLERVVSMAFGDAAELATVEEGELSFRVELMTGQKTGWFFDQRENRCRFPRYVGGQRVLDVFSYVGAWGVRAAASGAREVVMVDSSSSALDLARENAVRNRVDRAVRTIRADAFDVLKDLRSSGERFSVVVVDPPAFIKRRKDHREGLVAYRRLNGLAADLLAEDGVLVSCSCSQHLLHEELVRAVHDSAHRRGREASILEHGGQGPDHPVPAMMPELDYLKAVTARVSTP